MAISFPFSSNNQVHKCKKRPKYQILLSDHLCSDIPLQCREPSVARSTLEMTC